MSQLTLLSLLFFSSLITVCHSASLCNPIDKKALLEIKNQLGPKSSIFDTWQPNTDCCVSWINIGCNNRTKRVSTLTIGQTNELAGSIPTVVGELSGLELLYFNDMPGLVGPIPEAISKLPNLTELMLARTNLTGPIPDFMSRLQKLEILDLSENRLSGSIPSSLSKLRNLRQLQVQNNRLTGPIPDSFGSFKKLGFQADNNLLSGPIPKSLGRAGFRGLVLSNNRLTGDASVLFGKSKKAILIQLNNNAFSFDFSKIEFPSKLQGLDVSQNMIYGSIPAQVAELPLQLFNVSSNQLCGQIPTGKWVTQFGVDSFAHNKCLCGSPLAPCN